MNAGEEEWELQQRLEESDKVVILTEGRVSEWGEEQMGKDVPQFGQ
jgi:hypothetical protein